MLSGTSKIKRSTAVIILIITAVLWSSGGLLIKSVSLNPMAIAGTRSFITALFLLLILRKPQFTWSVPQLGGAVSLAMTMICFVLANKMTTAANAVLLQYTAPVFVALLGIWILKETVKLFDWAIIMLVMAGMICFFFDKLAPGGYYGNMVAILSGISYAFLFICMRQQKDESTLETILIGNVLTAFIGLPFISSFSLSSFNILIIVILGIFQLGLPYILYAIAIKRVSAIDAILILTLEPILNPIWVFFVIGETPGFWSIAGGLIVVVSITIRNIKYSLTPGQSI
jgi:drug/metabolite transporter (DMT)-like permease